TSRNGELTRPRGWSQIAVMPKTWDEKAGEAVHRAREDLEKKGRDYPDDEIKRLRRAAAESAAVCGDCFTPLAPNASVTVTERFVEHLAGRYNPIGLWIKARDIYLPVPICLSCWLIDISRHFWVHGIRGVRQ